jgi:undecaprenyl-diphosphatase
VSELEAVWLGIVQGLTEFLPVSSSGHLVLFDTLFGTEGEGGLVFEISVHVATLFAVVLFYRLRIFELASGALRGDADAWRYIGKLVVGTVPAGLIGVTFKDSIEQVLGAPWITGVCLIGTGFIVWSTRGRLESSRGAEPGWGAALLIGCAQAFALLPGISRSGSTVAAALALGVAPAAAAEFSFLLGVVAISGAAVLMLPDIAAAPPDLLTSVMLGGLAALISGLAALWMFVRMLRTNTFHLFAFYAWTVGSAFLAFVLLR